MNVLLVKGFMNVPQNKSIQISVASRDLKVILFDKIQTFSVRACAFARTRAGVDEFCAKMGRKFFQKCACGCSPHVYFSFFWGFVWNKCAGAGAKTGVLVCVPHTKKFVRCTCGC